MSLSAARELQTKGSTRKRRVRMAASITIYKGDFVMIDSNGVGQACASSASNRGCIAVAAETVTSDGSTATYILCEMGTFRVPGTSLTQAMVGTLVYGQADSTIGATGSNLPIAGVLEEYESASWGWIAVGSEYLT